MAAILGWALAFLSLALALHGRRRLRASGELVARASHEVRGPLTAAALAVHAAGREGELARPRVAAVELELRRAAVALDDLSAVPGRHRRHDDAERVDVVSLLDRKSVV